jgi:hypothetical protein
MNCFERLCHIFQQERLRKRQDKHSLALRSLLVGWKLELRVTDADDGGRAVLHVVRHATSPHATLSTDEH